MFIAMELLCRVQSDEGIIWLPTIHVAIDFRRERVGVVVLVEDIVFGITSNRFFHALVLQQNPTPSFSW
jgi:hypothetical protein